MWIITVIFTLLGIVLLSGKGSFLIAGYNTASQKEKEKFDEKKLCRVVGSGMLIIGLIAGLTAIIGTDSVIATRIFTIAIFVVIAALLFLTNKCCFSEEYKSNPELFKADQKKNRLGSYVVIGFVVVVGIFVGIMLETGKVTIEYNDTDFRADASFISGETVKYDTIKTVTYRTDFKVGNRVGGIGSFRLNAGRFSNDEIGRYTLYSYVNCKDFVEIKTNNGIFVINGETPEQTKQIYNDINQRIK